MATMRPMTVVARARERPVSMPALFALRPFAWSCEKVTRMPQTVPRSPRKGPRVTTVGRMKRFFSRFLVWVATAMAACDSRMARSASERNVSAVGAKRWLRLMRAKVWCLSAL